MSGPHQHQHPAHGAPHGSGGDHGVPHGAPHGGHFHDTAEPDWERLGPMLERGAEVQSPLYRQAAEWLAGLVPADREVRRVLDIGSGPGVITGLLAEVFPGAETVAVDGSPQLLERARDRAGRTGLGDRFRTVETDLPEGIEKLGEADLIWAGDSVHHLGDQGAAIAALGRLLRPGGVLALVEGGLPARHLPRDLGFGRPGLEARLDAANTHWFNRMRDELPGSRREADDWRSMFTSAGLVPAGTRSFLVDIPAPAPTAVREHIAASLTHRRGGLEGMLDAEDLAALDRLLDPDDPQGLRHREDTYLLAARTVYAARR
jgi:SAM-dependent methyltransferase